MTAKDIHLDIHIFTMSTLLSYKRYAQLTNNMLEAMCLQVCNALQELLKNSTTSFFFTPDFKMLSVSEYIAMAKEFIDEPIVASKVDAYIDENDEPEKVSIYQMQRQVKLHENEMTDIDQCYAFYIDPLIALHEKEHAMAYMGMSQFQFVNLMTEADEKGLEMIIEGLITHKTNITVLDGYRKKMGLKNKLTATIDTYFNIPEPLTEFGINEYKKFDLDRQTISFDSPETTVMYFDYLVTVLPWNVYNVEMSKDLHAESVLYEINGILIHLTRAANATSGKILLSREKEAKQAISNL